MKPVTYDFDVITDTPAPQRRAPDLAEEPPQADAEGDRKRVPPPERDARATVRAAE